MKTKHNPYDRLESDSGLFLTANADMVKPEEVLIIAPKYNSGTRHDATGAFHLGVDMFREVHEARKSRILLFDNRHGRYAVADQVLAAMKASPTKVLADFSHGYQYGIQAGIRCPNHPFATEKDVARWNEFCDILSVGVDDGFTSPVVLLFACSTGDDPDGDPDTAPGSGDGSFADSLRDALCERWATQCRILSHTTAGDYRLNRDEKWMDGQGVKEGGVGAKMLAQGDDADETRRMRTELARLLVDPHWCFTHPFRPIEDVRDELRAG